MYKEKLTGLQMLSTQMHSIGGGLYRRVGTQGTLVSCVLAVLHLVAPEGIVVRCAVLAGVARERLFA